jgi:PKD repeat protein
MQLSGTAGWSQFSTFQNPTGVMFSNATGDNIQYDIRLTVSNTVGSDTATGTNYITVYPDAPTANFNFAPSSINDSETVDFTDMSSGGPVSWSWERKLSSDSSWEQFSTDQNPTGVVFTNTGGSPVTYDIRLTASNSGGSDEAYVGSAITVDPAGPIAAFHANTTSLANGGATDFVDESSGFPDTYSWDRSPTGAETWETFSTMSTPMSISFTNSGDTDLVLDIRLSVSSAYGSNSYTRTGYMTIYPDAPTADFSVSNTEVTGDNTATIDFTDLSTKAPSAWTWERSPTGEGIWETFSTDQNPSGVTFTNNTPSDVLYDIRLTAVNSGGSGDTTKTAYITVHPAPIAPVADFSADDTTLDSDQQMNFFDGSTNSPTSWVWEQSLTALNDWTVFSSDQNPANYAFPSNNTTGDVTYDIRLTAANAAGSDTITKTAYITVHAAPPSADFSASPLEINDGDSVNFTDLSTGGISSWNWERKASDEPDDNFATFSTDQNPTAISIANGTVSDQTQDIRLTVSNDSGSSALRRDAYILVHPS